MIALDLHVYIHNIEMAGDVSITNLGKEVSKASILEGEVSPLVIPDENILRSLPPMCEFSPIIALGGGAYSPFELLGNQTIMPSLGLLGTSSVVTLLVTLSNAFVALMEHHLPSVASMKANLCLGTPSPSPTH